MFVTFFTELKSAGGLVTLREYLTLMEAMERNFAGRRVENFGCCRAARALCGDAGNLLARVPAPCSNVQ